MTYPKILVTSAAGHTGRPTVLQLLQCGFPVRAFVRTRDRRAMELERAGAEIFMGDLREGEESSRFPVRSWQAETRNLKPDSRLLNQPEAILK